MKKYYVLRPKQKKQSPRWKMGKDGLNIKVKTYYFTGRPTAKEITPHSNEKELKYVEARR